MMEEVEMVGGRKRDGWEDLEGVKGRRGVRNIYLHSRFAYPCPSLKSVQGEGEGGSGEKGGGGGEGGGGGAG